VDRFNEGWQHLFFHAHGNTTILGIESGSFGVADAISLDHRTDIVYTTACLTGHFDGNTAEPCLSEAFLRNGDGGAVVYIGCSRFGWHSPDEPPASNTSIGGSSNDYAYEFYQALFQNNVRIAGEAFTQHKANLSGSCHTYNS